MKKGAFLIPALAILLLFLPNPISAQKYRGDIEVSFGFPTSYLISPHDKFFQKSSFEFSSTHGVQINRFFIGAGPGLYVIPLEKQNYHWSNITENGNYEYEIYENSKNIPRLFGSAFIKSRYDFFNNKDINLFISLKVSYLIIFKSRIGNFYTSESQIYKYIEPIDGGGYTEVDHYTSQVYESEFHMSNLAFSPQVGVRFRIGKYTGINIGVSYNMFNIKEYIQETQGEYWHKYSQHDGIGETLEHSDIYNSSDPKLSNHFKGYINLTFGFDF